MFNYFLAAIFPEILCFPNLNAAIKGNLRGQKNYVIFQVSQELWTSCLSKLDESEQQILIKAVNGQL
jgi:hypothetical protein